ncbi:SDR family NAD(P)-dependent oxidoreductase [Skermanella mucosa]|uniref:SDR family NAD(P)-dependent oxidoreductase n=1 Tax=Skermanella mucosa TaxID=1789672 RepID=UPI00192C63E0|nr:SDR family NAD(P)-dependent oxidoreductase [Skermanella mucosa]UEM23151.1 SDR family NAD(P)-dependent oxidoreductase [Skermanella mucosa]
MNAPTWLVLGASSSIARAFALEAAAQGSNVILAGRDRADLDRGAADVRIRHDVAVEVVDFDAEVVDTHDVFVKDVTGLSAGFGTGPLNVFLAFGLMPDQSAIDADPDKAQSTIMATYAGAVSVLHRLAPILEAQGKGHIVALGSVAGDRGRIKNYVYGSAKAGLHAYLQGLRNRLFRSGVTVTTVKPGFIDTTMTWGMPGLFLVASPQDCARACLRYAAKGAEVRYFPAFWWIIMTIIRSIPEPIFKRLSI